MDTLEQWFQNGWLKRHTTSADEVQSLFEIIERDITDGKNSAERISLDNQLGILYNAALTLADVSLRIAGFRAKGEGHHERCFKSLPHTLGQEWYQTSRFLDTIRRRRNITEYDSAGVATAADIRDTIAEIEKLLPRVRAFAKEHGWRTNK